MKTAEKNSLVRSTLQWVNKIRKATGRKPLKQMPKGSRKDPMTCPIATALNTKYKASVEGRPFELEGITPAHAKKVIDILNMVDDDTGMKYKPEDIRYDERYFFEGPDVFSEFVSAFDEGMIPELVKPDEE